MRILVICTLLTALAFGCKTPAHTETPPTPAAPPTSQNGNVIYILHGTSYGHCVGYCIKEERYQELNIRTAQISRDSVSNPRKVKEIPLSDGEFSELSSLIDWNKWNQLETVIGCPDCADGGAEYIEIKTPEGARRVTFDAGSSPEGIEKLLDRMRLKRKTFYSE